MTSNVVAMRVAAEHYLHVSKLKAEGFNVLPNPRNRFLIAGIEKDMSFRGGDQVDAVMQRCSHIIDVADDAKGFGPPGAILLLLLLSHAGLGRKPQPAQEHNHDC